jgi:diguanylate cyclase (GGDEF)-like protein/PAS domain S-box-containing protein
MSAIARAARRRIGGVAWRQWLTVLIGAAVVVAMVLVAETARRDSERHLRAQVMVERVRVQGQAVGALDWQAIAILAGGNSRRRRTTVSGGLVSQGWATWSALSGALASLRAAEPGATATRLQRDALGLYTVGRSALAVFMRGDVKDALALNVTTVQPQLNRLDADAQQAAARQQTIANQASRRAAELYVGSLIVGLLLLFLVGWRLHRLRRCALLAEAQRALERRSEQRVRALIEHSTDVVTVIAPDLTVRWQSPSVTQQLGHDPDRWRGRRLIDLVHPDDQAEVERLLGAAGNRTSPVTLSARFQHAEGDWRHLETIADIRIADPDVQGIVLSMRDVTARQALEQELRHQAFHDALTGLANRALFEEHLVHALARARRNHQPVAVLFLDLDDFKTINDSLGHEAGDQLLRAVAIRIAGAVRAEDTAARLGGDEFAVLAETSEHEDDARMIATRLLAALAEPFDVAGRELRVSASVGVAWSDGSIGIRELMRDADTAMYAAKDAGKNTVRAFETGMHRRVLDRLELTGELQQAIEQEQFELEYQPVVDLQTGHIYGVEALVRWAHPVRGRVAPADFITLAEETGLIVPLGAWILRTACEQASRWNRELPDRPPITIGVNVSTRQLHDPSFPELVRDVLASTGVAPQSLALEITESMLPEDGAAVVQQLAELAALGVHIAVDDFGTGYSALSRLHHFPIDTVKIDRSFITGLERDGNKAQLVQGIVSLAESLNLVVVAEGIEHPAQAEQLRGMRAHYGQGYLFSPPVAPERLRDLLQDPGALAVAA